MNDRRRMVSASSRRAVMKWRGVAVVALMIGLLVHGHGQANALGPVRSGTVLNPAGTTGPGTCSGSPDCAAWLASHCDARLTGADPAAFASIVDVRDLAGTVRYVHARGTLGRHLSGAYYEFWAPGCWRVGSVHVHGDARVKIPRGAAWMTVPGSIGPYHWAMW